MEEIYHNATGIPCPPEDSDNEDVQVGGHSNEHSETQPAHGECCEECKRTCRRQFWTEVLKTVAKVAGAVLAVFGLQSFQEGD